MTQRTLISRLFAAAVAVVLAGSTANAGIIPTSVTVTPEAGNFRWTYAVVLPTDMKLQAGDYFTIYDFGGLVSGSVMMPDGWAFSSSNTGPTPGRLNPGDDADKPNLTFTYTGSEMMTGKVGLGNFMASSTLGQGDSFDTFFTGTNSRASDGSFDQNVTPTIVPGVPPTTPPPGVPEPTTLALAGMGLPLVGAARLWRKRKQK